MVPIDTEKTGIRVTAPGASEAELAAIAAAVEALWPSPQAELMVPPPPPPWRFSGRWWYGGDRMRYDF
ncbi:MAG TPA: hypothetical protein DGF10_00365 [Acidimicrobiaceae bacterium]|nr:hypothetical protein [Acidimicrobiaceae bacterium]HAQ23312.1 hypothetical protein [Acidimicrobiaceae bacterium]HCV33090.1 hypothetical protein [Acidimicrobiaceae bacterium]